MMKIFPYINLITALFLCVLAPLISIPLMVVAVFLAVVEGVCKGTKEALIAYGEIVGAVIDRAFRIGNRAIETIKESNNDNT